MRGMIFKFTVVHTDENGKAIGEDEFPVARVSWNDDTEKHMRRVGGGSVVQAHFLGLVEEVRKGLGPSVDILLEKVLARFRAGMKKVGDGQ